MRASSLVYFHARAESSAFHGHCALLCVFFSLLNLHIGAIVCNKRDWRGGGGSVVFRWFW